MAFLEWALHNWYWALVIYGGAFAVYLVVYVRGAVRAERAKLYPGADSRADSRADSDSDADCRANLHRAINRRPGWRSVQRVRGGNRSGRHDADRNPVRADAQAVA